MFSNLSLSQGTDALVCEAKLDSMVAVFVSAKVEGYVRVRAIGSSVVSWMVANCHFIGIITQLRLPLLIISDTPSD